MPASRLGIFMRHRVMLLGLAVPAMLLAQSPDQTLPRFRAGANLVHVDAYVSSDGVPLTDLTADDFTVYEDDKLQRVENFQLIRARAAVPGSEPRDANNTRDMRQQVADAARVFTLFFDPLYTSLSGSYYLQKPLVDTLNKVIGPDDMIGATTPDLSPSAITYSKRTESIEAFVTKNWAWGKRDRRGPASAEEASIAGCYDPDDKLQKGLAAEMIARMRERKTLDALQSLVTHLEGLRPERKFVLVFTEGWSLFRPSQSLTRTIDSPGPTPDPVSVDPRTGKIRPQGSPDPGNGLLTINACERLRIQLAQEDHERDFLELLQRANRANVSFYPVDARGLLVFDQPVNFDLLPTEDQAQLRRRHDFLKDMALQTDGYAVLDTGHVTEGLTKIFRDVGSYYLMSYYSTNPRLDGRFRRIRVEVKRHGADVRARPGYLAPTEAEARTASAGMTSGTTTSSPPPTVTRALDSLVPTRGNLPLRVQAIGARNTIRAIVELDAATAKQPEWLTGGTLRLTIEAERGAGAASGVSQTETVAIDPGQRSIAIGTGQPLSPGRYSVRAELTPRNGRTPLQVSTAATVPADSAEVGTGLLASRRGPSTGLAYIATADARFRRTERLRVEVPLASDGFAGAGRVLTRDGQPTALLVSFATRVDGAQHVGVGDVALAPLAEGEYVLELSLTKNGATEVVSYGFRIVP